ncbi:hypothetical protein ABD91_21060 [Lysinibacillus sphaericus]|uniref:hypothetical protein n=1 Tax=Lysinibacillus sphaericus TaxID=1421 RepID=UPI0018CDD9DD|nr:hypothetical protein [Lysinibacillus sphaericus]MBG9693231.1 hypothetical protein [Lysinibacillus sphaericus]
MLVISIGILIGIGLFILYFTNYWLENPANLQGLELYQGNETTEKFLFFFQDFEVRIVLSLAIISLILLIFTFFRENKELN